MCVSHYLLPCYISYPCLCMRVSNVDKVHQLVYIFTHRLPCGNINDTPVYSRVKCYSGIPCACGFIRGSWNTCHPNWHLRASSLFPDGDDCRRQQCVFIKVSLHISHCGVFRGKKNTTLIFFLLNNAHTLGHQETSHKVLAMHLVNFESLFRRASQDELLLQRLLLVYCFIL